MKTHCYVVVTKQLPSFCPFPFLNVIEYNWILFWKIWKHIKIISEHGFISKTPEKTVQFKSQAIQYKHINIRSTKKMQLQYDIYQNIKNYSYGVIWTKYYPLLSNHEMCRQALSIWTGGRLTTTMLPENL